MSQKYTDGGYIDLDQEVVIVDGKRLTEAEAEKLGEDIIVRHRSAGRPSLGGGKTTSPTVNARVPDTLKRRIAERAAHDGVRESEVVRRAIEVYLDAS